MNRILILIFITSIFGCSDNSKKVINNELAIINESLKKISQYNYEFIENEFRKYPNKLKLPYEKAIFLKSVTQKLEESFSRESSMTWEELKGQYVNYQTLLKDSIFIKEIDYQKDSLYRENDEYTYLIFQQVFKILDLSNHSLDNKEIIKNKLLLGEQMTTEYIKNSMYRFDYHFNMFESVLRPVTPTWNVKLGESFRTEILLSSTDRNIKKPLFLYSNTGGINKLENSKPYRMNLKNPNSPYFLKSNSTLINDTIFYKDHRYYYESKPTKKGRYSFGGELMLVSPISGDTLGFPFAGEYWVY